jgi:hypothetical protein
LLVAPAGSQADVDFEGGPRLSLIGLIPGSVPSLAVESAVRLKDAKAPEFTLERGRVLLSNRGEKAAAGAKVQFAKETWDFSLEPGAQVLLERSAYWPAGVALPKERKEGEEPLTNVVLLVTKGNVTFRVGADEYALRPMSLYQWSNAVGPQGPVTLKQVPGALAEPAVTSAAVGAFQTAANRLRAEFAKDSPADVVRKARQAPANATRRAALFAAAAMGELAVVLDGLADPKNADTREAAVLALRHWVGLGDTQAPVLYDALRPKGKAPALAGTVLHLLRSFSQQDRARPETYDTLIDYLDHPDIQIRELAAWQLYRLVPQGRDIAYDAAAEPQARARARADWRKLIPEGQLPPKK